MPFGEIVITCLQKDDYINVRNYNIMVASIEAIQNNFNAKQVCVIL